MRSLLFGWNWCQVAATHAAAGGYSASLLVTRGMATGGGLSPGSVYYVVTMGMGLS